MSKNITILLVLNICFFASNFVLQAQEIMYLKQMYQRPEQGKIVDEQGVNINYDMPLGTHSDIGKPWVVFSDRNGNKTYAEPNLKSDVKNANIKFMERFYVVDEKNDFVKVATGEVDRGNIKIKTVYGWIPKKNLLLWTHCIVNDKEITKKALVLNNIDIMKDKVDTSKLVKFYAHPDMAKRDYITTSRLFKVYYVYKVLPDGVLVGKQKSFETNKYEDAMLGWSSVKKITFWDSRVCLEHNSNREAVEERAKYDNEYLFFDTEEAANVYKNGQMPSSKHIIMKMSDLKHKRKAGNVMRFPILAESDGILKVVIFDEAKKEQNITSTKIAYTVLKRNNNTKYNLYQHVLFLDNAELSETIRILNTFTNSDLTHEELLTLIENTWRTILQRYEGVGMTDYEDSTLEQIHEKVFGLPVQSDFLSEIKLKNIKDMPYEQAKNYIEIMTNSHSRLNNILRTGENHPFSFSNDADIYYWILARELP